MSLACKSEGVVDEKVLYFESSSTRPESKNSCLDLVGLSDGLSQDKKYRSVELTKVEGMVRILGLYGFKFYAEVVLEFLGVKTGLNIFFLESFNSA